MVWNRVTATAWTWQKDRCACGGGGGTKDDILVDKSDVANHTLRSLKPEKAMPKFTPVQGIEFCIEE